MYELLWRWRDAPDPSRSARCGKAFHQRFGFSLPHTVIVSRGRIQAWYFTSKKDGSLMRKKADKLSCTMILQELLKSAGNQEVVAQWIPVASQFQVDRSSSSNVEFLTRTDVNKLLDRLTQYNSGVLQEFVYPNGISNSMIRAMEFQDKITISVRYNRHLLHSSTPIFKRCATFEGWNGLSSVQHKFNPSGVKSDASEDEKIRNVATALNARVRQESVRQMHFLQPNQYIVFHFKLDRNFIQQFLFASIISEEEAFSQSLDQLLLEDPIMKCSLEREIVQLSTARGDDKPEEAIEKLTELARALDEPFEDEPEETATGKITSARRRVIKPPTFLPKSTLEVPAVPPVPYSTNVVPHHNEESGRFEYPPPYVTPGCIKQPLISWD